MGEEFEVRGPHEAHLEHAAEHEPKGLAGQLAVTTAVLATFGAMFSYMAGATQADAGLLKNDAAIAKTEASNQWNFYQAKSSKQNLAELGLELASAERKPFFQTESKRYQAEKAEIRFAAEKIEKEALSLNTQSEVKLHQHHRWAQATTAMQVAIALAAIALLTERRWLGKGVFLVGGIGIVVGALAYLHI